MRLTKNQHRLIISTAVALLVALFNGCSEPIANKVNISVVPERPQVQFVSLAPPVIDDDDTTTFPGLESGVEAPWFQYDFVVENDSDKVFVLFSLEIISTPVGGFSSSTVSFDVNTLTEEEIDPQQPLSLARIEANTEWAAADNLGITINSAFASRFFGVGGLPQDREFGDSINSVYEVEVRALGFFEGDESSSDPDDDDTLLFERSYRFFTR